MTSDGFVCRFCLRELHKEEACNLPQPDLKCDVCQETFDTSESCWDCYWLPFPLRVCTECLAEDAEIYTESTQISDLTDLTVKNTA